MKGLKKITALVVLFSMVATLCAIPVTKTDAAVKFYYGKKLTIAVGSSDEIIVKNQKKATYKTSNKKIATVNKKGKVVAKKVGTCKITVKIGNSKAKATINVVPKTVKIKSAKLSSVSTVKVKWRKVKDVKGYYVYYSTKYYGPYKKIKVKGADNTSVKIENLEAGKNYYFKVKAYATKGKKQILSSEFSKIKKVKTWKLTWNDEFNGTSLDPTKWNNEGATGDGGYGNKELQNYQMEYSEVKDGNYIIKPQFKWNAATQQLVRGSYYSTKIWTKNLYSVKYGKIEFCAKLPKGRGTWAAAWMLGEKNKWPLCGEIDILETTSNIAKDSIPQSIHCGRFNGMPTSPGNKGRRAIVSDATSAYHTYGIIWDEDKITFTVDGKETWTYDPDMYSSTGEGSDDPYIWPFNQNFYLILNCAIGGNLGGPVLPDYWTKIATDGDIETYEDYFYIDYVRVYK